MGNGKLESPLKFGDGGKSQPSGPQPAGGKFVSPVKSTNKSEAKNHDNGYKG